MGAKLEPMVKGEGEGSADFDAGRYFAHAGRIIQENGADIVKTYFVDGFEEIREGVQTPIVIAGGKKIPEAEAALREVLRIDPEHKDACASLYFYR